ncbi:MAG: hypothetical protein FJY62_00440 [Betaproteobacteria bacterium]|nr:hypothetical protein [Betaproteobacteria bacterium]
MFNDHREKRLRAARARHPSADAFIPWSPRRLLQKLRLDYSVLDSLKAFLLVTLIGLALNYAYYESFSLHYLFIRGIQDWFIALQVLLDYGVGSGYRYNALYVLVNGTYYFYLVRAGIALIDSVIHSLRPFRNTAVITGIFALLWTINDNWDRLGKWVPTP